MQSCHGLVRAATIQGNTMSSNLPQAALASAGQILNHSGNWVSFINRTLRGLLTTAQHTLMLFGLGSLALIGLLYLNPESINRLQAGMMRISGASAPAAPITGAVTPALENNSTAPVGTTTVQPVNSAASAPTSTASATAGLPHGPIHGNLAGNFATNGLAKSGLHSDSQHEQRWVANWLSRRYRVAAAATVQMVHTAYQTAHDLQIDPLLILAVVAIESRFNPIAESPMGAQGLMQVMSKVHHDKFKSLGGVNQAFNPVANIKVGSRILKDYVTRGGSMEAGLKTYVGAAAFDSDTGYGSKVLAEYQRLKQVASGKTVPLHTASVALPQPKREVAPVAQDEAALPAEAPEKDRVAAL